MCVPKKLHAISNETESQGRFVSANLRYRNESVSGIQENCVLASLRDELWPLGVARRSGHKKAKS